MSDVIENEYDELDDSGSNDTTKDRFLTFEIDKDEYGIEIAYVKEIIRLDTVTVAKMPQTSDYIKGIMNLRGDIIPVLDVRVRFHKPEMPSNKTTCIIVIDYMQQEVGLIVDTVYETVTINEEDIIPPPNVKMKYYNQFIKNIGRTGDTVKLLLDLEKFLAQEM